MVRTDTCSPIVPPNGLARDPRERHLAFQEILEAGDTATVRVTLTARHVGEFMGVPATGRDIVLPGITTLRFAGDRCVERHTVTDMLGLMVQLGAVPAPA